MPARTDHPDVYQPLRTRAVGGVRLTEGLHSQGGVIPWHTHEGPTMCMVLRGAFVEYSAGRVTDCYPASLKFTPAAERHWNRFHVSDVRGFMAEFDPSLVTSDPGVSAALARQAQYFSGPELGLAGRIYAEFRIADTAAPLAIEGLTLELLALLARRAEIAAGGRAPRWARRAHELVHAFATRPLTLSTIAAEVGVHPATLARGFRRAYGCTIGELQRTLRLQHSMVELLEGRHSLAEIAQRAGFYDQSHFTNAFQRAYGTTPARYRAAATT